MGKEESPSAASILSRKEPDTKSLFEEMGGTYTLVGDYYIPDLKVSKHEETRPIGRWGHEHLRYIKEYRPLLYTELVLSGDLGHYLADIDEQARERLDRIMAQMRAAEGVTEELKHRDQLGWVGAMNSIRSRAEEIIRSEIIYV